MIALVQRVVQASVSVVSQTGVSVVSQTGVSVGQEAVSSIGEGILVLLGVKKGDSETTAERLAGRCANLRIFEDTQGKFNHSLKDVGGSALVVSQFTLVADTARGRRPSFTDAEEPARSEHLYEIFVRSLKAESITTKTGSFGAHMLVNLVNDGPVTIILEE